MRTRELTKVCQKENQSKQRNSLQHFKTYKYAYSSVIGTAENLLSTGDIMVVIAILVDDDDDDEECLLVCSCLKKCFFLD